MNKETIIDSMFEHRDIIEQLVSIGTNNYPRYCQYMTIHDMIDFDISKELIDVMRQRAEAP